MTPKESDQSFIDRIARFRTQPLEFLREISLHVSGTGWRSYDHIIGQPVFYQGFSEKMKNNVMVHPNLQAKIAELAQKRVAVEDNDGLFGTGLDHRVKMDRRRRDIEKSLREVSEDLLDKMICKMESKRFIRGAYWLVTQLMLRIYNQGIHVSSEEVIRLREVAEQAAKKKQSIIFLPCHRSHIDYVSLQVICYRLGMTLPTVVAGDNLNFPVVGPFLQHAGAMWIRRSFGDDQLYTTIVQSYMDTLLANGFNVECFIEGGRSRTGKLLSPKFGILGFFMDSIYSGRVEDALVCPVSTQYDKVLEVDSYVSELLGQPKRKENLGDFLSSSSLLSLKLGRVDVRFHEPWSLRQFIDEQHARFTKMPPQINESDEHLDERVRLLRTFGYRVLKEINDVSVVMPTALIGTVLLTLRGRGVGKSELIRRVEWLSERVKSRGGRVAHLAGTETSVVVERGLQVLGPNLVGVQQGLAEETYYAVDRFQLSFYRNMTIHLFVLEALVSAGMYINVKQGGGPEQQRISYEDLRAQVSFLSRLFRGEFIFPTEGLEVNLSQTLKILEQDNVIKVVYTSTDPTKVDYVTLSDFERESGRENYDFYCFLIWPFVEASWLGAISLMMLTPPLGREPARLELNKVQNQAQLFGKTLYYQGDLSYIEAVNKETLKNAYQRFEDEGIIIVTKSRDKKIPVTVRLADEWTPPRDPESGRLLARGKLWEFADMISQSRREGKNRRDGATVKTRVLGLADKVGQALFDDAATAAQPPPHEDSKTVERPVSPTAGKAKRRRRGIMQSRSRL
ncbi:acyltransferase-domain-containing protein [Rhizodiscina lignyota]|uniref:Acyltransferase-domain-containing protein n=1 Tax=Rhizodiscina lignyota TaxID=1504668 RepID=A0A9P4M9V0_9PEZI|nr:acyltransferase-domain-containing protein [Rhizodiscina lignyota]